MAKQTHQRLVALISQVLDLASSLEIQEGKNKPAGLPGILPAQSKYNPWRAYVWDSALRKQVYLGMFPSQAKAKAAQRAYRAGRPVVCGTKAPLTLVNRKAA